MAKLFFIFFLLENSSMIFELLDRQIFTALNQQNSLACVQLDFHN